MLDYNATKQKLSPQQKEVLVQFLVDSAEQGFGQTPMQVVHEATTLYAASGGDTVNNPFGINWADQFLLCHRDHLQTYWSKSLDMQRANTLNPTVTDHWFNHIVKEHIAKKHVEPDCIYEMDESGFS